MMMKSRCARGVRCFALAASGLLALAAPARAQTAVAISVDGSVAGTPLQPAWPFYGYDEVNYTTTAPGKDLLAALAQMNRAPVHVRTHFLLNTGDGTPSLKWGSTNVYTETAAGMPVYSWTLLDGIMDAITGAGAFPFAEIGFMPQALSVHPTPYQNSGVYQLDGGCFYPPKDYAKWGALIQAWANHVKDRYPDAERTWQWELWNEPNIGYWHGTFAEYAKLYDYTESALHGVMPNAPLGGPAETAPGAFLKQFLDHCANGTNAVTGKIGTRLDMVTFHAKGGVTVTGGHVEMNLGHQLALHQAGFSAVANVPAFKSKPIVVTEADPDGCAACSAAQTPADAYRNSPAYAAYEVAMMKRSLELSERAGVNLRGLVTWAFLFNDGKYFPGYRVLRGNGIDLPVLNGFKLLGALTGNRLPVTSSGARPLDDLLKNSVRQEPDIDALATQSGRTIQVLVWNYHDDLVAAPAAPVSLSLKVPADFGARALLTHQRADETHGDAYTVWVAQGKPAAPSPTQIQQLKDGMEPVALEPARTVDVANGVVNVTFDLPRFGISLLTFTPADSPDAGTGETADAGSAAGGAASGGFGGAAAGGNTDISGTSGMTSGAPAASAGAGALANAGAPTVPAPTAADSRGCSCRLAPARGSGLPASSVWLSALALLGLRRNRKRPSVVR
jgi:xylan 1,4-beta-xylosidase